MRRFARHIFLYGSVIAVVGALITGQPNVAGLIAVFAVLVVVSWAFRE